MIYVVTAPCVDVLDRGCIDVCPVDCIYEGERSVYIQPDECVGCAACESVCPVEAIYREDEVPAQWSEHRTDNARFFPDVLGGRAAPLASPGGASRVGRVGVDTALVSRVETSDAPASGRT